MMGCLVSILAGPQSFSNNPKGLAIDRRLIEKKETYDIRRLYRRQLGTTKNGNKYKKIKILSGTAEFNIRIKTVDCNITCSI
jgi:hypothetical protein